MKATAVVGAGFGDEGKGLVVDYLAAQDPSNTLVIRYNGGAQAAHTVETPDGVRHVFHHHGSGTLAGAESYLARHFVVNPLVWNKEHSALKKLGATPELYIDRDALVTTPYDMLINQEIEALRGSARHGSCGLGVNETVTRSNGWMRIKAFDLALPRRLNAMLTDIRDRYVPARMKFLSDLGKPSERFMDLVQSQSLLDSFMEAAHQLIMHTEIATWPPPGNHEHYIFEGAQGLLLDEQCEFFPHVTRSRTGSYEARKLTEMLPTERELHVIYVTRSYMTRHGAGPFPSEDPAMRFSDPTNVPNEFQGALRFGSLDVRLIAKHIALDAHQGVRQSLAMTCCDQHAWTDALEQTTGLRTVLKSYGPTRRDVRFVPPTRTVEPGDHEQEAVCHG